MEEDEKRYVRKNTLTDSEARLFRANYEFMWKELGSSPYAVRYSNDKAYTVKNTPIQGEDNLPSYSILFSCYRENYTPTLKVVYKIVSFFNANFSPSISPWQFLNEDLAQNANVRYKGTSKYDSRFIGTYNCYYTSSNSASVAAGAILKIYLKDNVLKACLITGIHSDDDFQSKELRTCLEKEPLTKKDFDKFQSSRVSGNKRYYFFEGNAEVTASSVLIVFYNYEEDDARKLIFTLNTKRFPSSRKEPYHGGLAFVMTTSDNPFDTRFYPMGLINSKYEAYSIQDEQIAKLLKLRITGKDIRLTTTADDAWYKLALNKMK
ncbi:MAG: hypothetical protein Q4E24_15245 [bacterium]|nr:hypothetical protein [bacterium]